MRLTARKIKTLTARGLYADGGNLYLKVGEKPSQRSWVFRYMIRGRARSMGLGDADIVSLVEARNKKDDAFRQVRAGQDPLDERATTNAKGRAPTFKDAAQQYSAAQAPGWGAKHLSIWRASVATYAEPNVGSVPVERIDTDLVLKVLQPIWQTKTETASRLRGRIEMVLSYSKVRGWRDGPNPAMWRGHLEHLLAPRSKVQPVEHFPALDWRKAPSFMAKLREQDGIGAVALRFAILTAARSSSVRGATWDELDLDQAVWTIPGLRMKAGKEHKTPLSKAAIALLKPLALLRNGERGLVFPGKGNRPLSENGLSRALAKMGRDDLTVHGFRSTFRDWASEATAHPGDVAEKALAHTVGSKVRRAYERGDLFTKRRVLMDDWAAYLDQSPAEIVPFRPTETALSGAHATGEA